MAAHFFDGTWNQRRDAGEYGLNTNVVKLFDVWKGSKYMYNGPGTRHGLIGRIFGGAFGAGVKVRVAEAIANVEKDRANGDFTIDAFGFSRGGAAAVQFAFECHKRGWDVRFLGLWDVVASFGIPIDIGPLNFNKWNIGYTMRLFDNVEYCFHALAKDEQRAAFKPTRLIRAKERIFRGVHTDVGGGGGNELLSNITLQIMAQEAATQGCQVDAGALSDLPIDSGAEITVNKPVGDSPRVWKKDDVFV